MVIDAHKKVHLPFDRSCFWSFWAFRHSTQQKILFGEWVQSPVDGWWLILYSADATLQVHCYFYDNFSDEPCYLVALQTLTARTWHANSKELKQPHLLCSKFNKQVSFRHHFFFVLKNCYSLEQAPMWFLLWTCQCNLFNSAVNNYLSSSSSSSFFTSLLFILHASFIIITLFTVTL